MRAPKAFSLLELIIVVSILGILAAVVLPTFRAHAEEAKEAASKDNLRILRNTIEYYASQHGGVPPGYLDDDPSQAASYTTFWIQVVRDGHYLSALPKSPYNDSSFVTVLSDGDAFPAEAPGDTGWIYKPAAREIRLNWPGTDSKGVRYYDY